MPYFGKRSMREGRDAVCIRGFYFLYFCAIGCTFPYLNLYYREIGFTGVQIGFLAATSTLIILLASPLWGIVSDTLNVHRALLTLAVGGTILPALLLSVGNTMTWLVPVTVVYAFFMGPIGPLADSTALEVANSSQRTYGEFRAWGTLGFTISAWLIGKVIERTSLTALFYGYVFFMLGCLAFSLFLQPGRQRWEGTAIRGFRTLLGDSAFRLFLTSAFVLTAAVAATNNFFALYLRAIGAGAGLVGLASAVAALCEVPVIYLSAALLRRVTAGRLLVLASAVYVVRWVSYSQITVPTAVLAIQTLHGLSYGALVVAGVVYTGQCAPNGLSATAQSLYSGTTMGVAGIVGALAGGWLYDSLGVAALFRVCSVVAVIALLLFLALPHQRAEGLRATTGT